MEQEYNLSHYSTCLIDSLQVELAMAEGSLPGDQDFCEQDNPIGGIDCFFPYPELACLHFQVEALEAARPEGITRPFTDLGESMKEALASLHPAKIETKNFFERLVSGTYPKPHFVPVVKQQSLVEPLSERKIEVLRLVADGLSNQEFASKLYVTLNTVKAHIKHIHGKLGVENRTQAGNKARELGLI